MGNIRPQNIYDADEEQLLESIRSETSRSNIDNISRTQAYFEFYLKEPDMVWAFLASMVSRNAGWNMCDLRGQWFPRLLEPKIRNRLFLAYERANWLIFRDAYPQLLLYQNSTKKGRQMFHLLPGLDVSAFMEHEWRHYWEKRDKKRLMTALIINEQNVIQKPVIKHHFYKDKVFNTALFTFQDRLHFSSVLFPTCSGELFGASVNGFRSVNKRIDLGKRLADILFDDRHYRAFLEFALRTEHTGSRNDYEQYFRDREKRDTPFLRLTYPVISHNYNSQEDWFSNTKIDRAWFKPDVRHHDPVHVTDWYREKQIQLHSLIMLNSLFRKKKR
ncbi:DUF2515 domain-containing protein [Bacillus sp. T33-2]|uniref:DUF2515 domain-containing protein n=1 Tax=Bacillus sp. T33-2 TaxID=2054168 RepID=UPI000C782D43|nr:DUF2515 domain-containing protein [Bacillus sp. T33-2]PLR99710.1 DUF2515 domain-containing protein [Bacillus sp. T33-2]